MDVERMGKVEPRQLVPYAWLHLRLCKGVGTGRTASFQTIIEKG